ncbi:hypothetical protein [Dyadobacter sediminis]|uniref:Uncharacterized protein n=1 Tax=Dyadobacter sediminis TaxID=1493691 RepID=A0A5R9K709_9BACT|nr:hypothetical protein [Dyadobacter sediminis]TLU89570.1 hypothetical protein FEM55_22805 [Dyadobacter sediminis]
MKNLAPLFLVFTLFFGLPAANAAGTSAKASKMEMLGKKKKYKGYKKPRSKKILGIFKRKSDCGCPNH